MVNVKKGPNKKNKPKSRKMHRVCGKRNLAFVDGHFVGIFFWIIYNLLGDNVSKFEKKRCEISDLSVNSSLTSINAFFTNPMQLDESRNVEALKTNGIK